MSEPIISGASAVAGKVAITVARNATLDWRIVADVVTRARAQSVRVSKKQLRAALNQFDVFEAVMSGNAAGVAVIEKLDRVECNGWDSPSSSILLPLLRTAAVRQVSIQESQGMLHEEIARLRESMEASADVPRDPTITFPQPLRDDLAHLRDAFGDDVIRRMSDALASIEQRPQLLKDWLESRPNWLPESEQIDGWLGLLAQSADMPDLSREWIERALAAGASPRAYWMTMIATIGRSPEAAIAYLEPVRGYPLVEAVLTENSAELREDQLLKWKPTTQMQRALWCSMRAQQQLESGRLDEAIETGLSGFRDYGFGTAGLVGARAMMARSSIPGTGALIANLVAARALALDVRDARRVAGMLSAEAIVIAIHASLLLMDTRRACALFTAAPEGEATGLEAEHSQVREAGVAVLCQLGELSKAKEMLADDATSAVALQVRAREAEMQGNEDAATRLWSDAVGAVDDWNEKTSLCFLLALRGIVHPFVEELRGIYSDIATEVDTVAHLFQRRPGAEARAAAEALDNPRIARALSKYYSDNERSSESLRLAEHSARRWGDPDEWLNAARIYLRRGMHEKAIDRARRAAKAGGSAWGDHVRAAQIEVEATHRMGDWDEAVAASRALVALDPDSSEAAWSLIVALKHAAEDDQAFLEWRGLDVCRVPDTAWHAVLWLDLYQRHGTAMAPFSEVLAISLRFSNDEQVRRMTVGALLLAPLDELDSEVGVVELAEQFHTDFPEGPKLLQTVHAESDDGAALLAALDQAAGGPRQPSELDRHAAFGTMPVGLISMFARRGFAQSLIERRNVARFAGRGDWNDESSEAVAAALQRGAALDTTAALTLAMLPADLSEQIARFPAALFGTYTQLRDAHDAARELGKDGGVFFPSTESRGAFFYEPSEDERSKRRDLVQKVITQLRLTERTDPPKLAIPERDIADLLGPWSEAIARAAEEQVPLWCDDAATRIIAELAGVSAFGTPELVEYLRIAARITEEQATAIDAALIMQHLVGVRFRKSTWDLAASLDSSRPSALAQAIEFGGPSHADEKIGYALRAMGRCADEPEALREWSATVTRYLLSIGGDETGDVDNLATFCNLLLVAPWSRPHHLPFLFEGIRSSCGDRWYAALRKAFADLWSAVRGTVAADFAASYLMGLLRDLPDEERRLALEIVLRDKMQ